MRTVNVHEAKTTLSKLLDEVERGGRIIIARDGEPIAELRAISKPTLSEAIAVVRAQSGITIAGLDLRELIEEGRR